jgi:hypothetical protein
MAIVKRLDKGSALTYAELDGNFDHLTFEDTAIRAEFASADENKQPLDATLTAIADESIGAFSHRNKIINGNFGINQRVYVSEAETTEGQYTLDRWKVTTTSGITFSTSNNKTTVTIPTGQTFKQVVEGLNLKSGTYVLSWGGTAQGRIAGGTYGASGSVTASITGGTDTTIEFNAGTVYEVQFEIGSVATSFEHRHYGTELAMCQRYYEKSYPVSVAPGTADVFESASLTSLTVNTPLITSMAVQTRFRVPKQAVPTVAIYSASGAAGQVTWKADGGWVHIAGTPELQSTESFDVYNDTGQTAVAAGLMLHHWTASAEL